MAINEQLEIVRRDATYEIVSPEGVVLGVIKDPAAAQAIQYALNNIAKPLRGRWLNPEKASSISEIPELTVEAPFEKPEPNFYDVLAERFENFKCIE